MGAARAIRGLGLARSSGAIAAVILCAACAGGGGSGSAQTTRLQTGDFQVMTAELALGLSRSEVLVDRGPDEMPMTIAMDQVENLTTDIITPSEGWYLMDRVRDAQDVVSLSQERSVRFVIPAARVAGVRGIEPEALADRAPTHALRATIRSLTRQAGDDRTELYEIEYRLVELDSGGARWVGTYPLKRAAFGRAWD